METSEEEDNFSRVGLLLTGVCQRAVRLTFDSKYNQANLNESLNTAKQHLTELMINKVINQNQWNILYPVSGECESRNLDLNLMITLFHHLQDPLPPSANCKNQPNDVDNPTEADLTTIRLYRNYLAHLPDSRISKEKYEEIWKCVTGVIGRLEEGKESNLLEEANLVRTRPLDYSSHEIADLREELQKIKDPLNLREKAGKLLRVWRENNKDFVDTAAAKSILRYVQNKECVTITGSYGIGKTEILRHVILQMADSGYDIIIISDPYELNIYIKISQKIVFVVDDICGKHAANKNEVDNWRQVTALCGQYLNDDVKLVVSCRLQVCQDSMFRTLSLFKSCVCNLSDLKYSEVEIRAIATKYLGMKAANVCQYASLYDCFPLLCKLNKDKPSTKHLFRIFEEEINTLKEGHFSKYCALALCVISDNFFKEDWLIEDIDDDTRALFETVYKECKLDFGTSRIVIRDELETLLNTFLTKKDGVYKIVDSNLLIFLKSFFDNHIVLRLIKNATSKVLNKKCTLFDLMHASEFLVRVSPKQHSEYGKRMVKDWKEGQVEDVFSNPNMIFPDFRCSFLSYVCMHNENFQHELAHTCDVNSGNSVLLHCCYYDDTNWIRWCIYFKVKINQRGKPGTTPLQIACANGHTDIVKILIDNIDNQADINNCTTELHLCETPSTLSPLFMACINGHTEIVRILLKHKAQINDCFTTKGTLPLHAACQEGHADIVKILISASADVNLSEKGKGNTPLIIAAFHERTDVVEILLTSGADVNESINDSGMTPLLVSCSQGHFEITEKLLASGANIDTINQDGKSPIHVASQNGYVKIVAILLSNNANINLCAQYTGESPLHLACQGGHKDVVELLLNRNAEFDKCRYDSWSPLHIACFKGHKVLVESLLEKGANHNLEIQQTRKRPIDIARRAGHEEIVHILENKY